MNEYWLISVPEKNDHSRVLANVEDSIQQYCTSYRLVIPKFKFGNIDDLIKFSEESGKISLSLEAGITQIVQNIKLLLDEREELLHHLQVNGKWIFTYLDTFNWDHLKYPTRKTPKAIISDIREQGTLIIEKMKAKVSEFNTLKNEVEKIEIKHTGSLLVRDLSDFVKKEDIIIGSKFLQTVLILVPSIDIENWKNFYEHFWQGIVPGSTKLLYRDNDFGLFTVVVTKQTVDGFKAWSLKSRIIVRKFEYNEEEIRVAKISEHKCKMQLTVNRRNLHFWLKKHYSLCFSMYFHIQILRVINESILKYGLKMNYNIILIKPLIKNLAKLRNILNNNFSWLEENLNHNSNLIDECIFDFPSFEKNYYYSYVNSIIHVVGCPMKTKIQLLESLTKSSL